MRKIERLKRIRIENKRRIIINILILVIFVLAAIVFGRNDSYLYKRDIGQVVGVKTQYALCHKGSDGQRSYKEDYYDQTLRVRMLNGRYKGRICTVKNRYAESQVYDEEYSKSDQVFIDNISRTKDGGLRGNPAGLKRDWLVISVLTLLFGLFLVCGGREGVLTIISLFLNLFAFYWVLVFYHRGYSILWMTIPIVLFFTWMLLFFMYGRNEKTRLSFVATIATVTLTTLIATGCLLVGHSIDYDFMDYLNHPYVQHEANLIFISEIIIGCLGGVMDVVVTMVVTVSEISASGGDLSRKSLLKSCRSVGDDLIGTMINLMFLTNIAGGLPQVILSMRNGISLRTVIRYNAFFDVARFLTGSIGVVLAIPISSIIAILYYRKKVKEC